tara:strand:+ start:2834 stop:3625 length:792 start_codon:yes stop_codon:yes gene_type:complete
VSFNAAIVIPIYNKYQSLNTSELNLFEQIKTVFTNREIFIILPKSLENDWEKNSEFKIISFNDTFFESKLTYSKLLCRKLFYESFSDYDYIQIIQTDCWVFEDKLDYFTNLGFDYIGAPWMEGGFDGYPKEKLWKTGNGGFSLRKVSTFITILEQIGYSQKGKLPVFKTDQKSLKSIIKNFGIRNNLKHYTKEVPGEDIFWCMYVTKIFKPFEFKIADPVTAAHYAFEVLPQFLFDKITNGKLPMGSHNWMNNNPEFWNKYIP